MTAVLEIDLGSFDSKENGEHSSVDLVEISKILVTQDNFSYRIAFHGVYQDNMGQNMDIIETRKQFEGTSM